MIVRVADKADDKNKKTVKKSSTRSRSKSKTTDKRKADDLPENSVSQDASLSGDNDNDDDGDYQTPSKGPFTRSIFKDPIFVGSEKRIV